MEIKGLPAEESDNHEKGWDDRKERSNDASFRETILPGSGLRENGHQVQITIKGKNES